MTGQSLPEKSASGPTGVLWNESAGQDRLAPRECIRNAREALNHAYASSEPPWNLIADAVDWQRRALEQMVGDG